MDKTLEFLEKKYGKKPRPAAATPLQPQPPVSSKPVSQLLPEKPRAYHSEKMNLEPDPSQVKESTVYQPLELAAGDASGVTVRYFFLRQQGKNKKQSLKGREVIESMLKSKEFYTEKIANKAFLLDKYDLGGDEKKKDLAAAKPEEIDNDKEHIGIRFDNIEKLEEYKKLRDDYASCLKLNQMWNSYINNLVSEK